MKVKMSDETKKKSLLSLPINFIKNVLKKDFVEKDITELVDEGFKFPSQTIQVNKESEYHTWFTRFNLKETVFIESLGCSGIIVSIHLNLGGTLYDVAYFIQGQRLMIQLLEEELSVVEINKKMGF